MIAITHVGYGFVCPLLKESGTIHAIRLSVIILQVRELLIAEG